MLPSRVNTRPWSKDRKACRGQTPVYEENSAITPTQDGNVIKQFIVTDELVYLSLSKPFELSLTFASKVSNFQALATKLAFSTNISTGGKAL